MTREFTASKTVRKHPNHTMHPNSLKNLIPYKPGQNGNPKPGNSLTAQLKNALVDNPELAKQFIASTIQGAIKREPTPFRELWDRVDGKLVDKTAILGDIVIEVIYDDRHKAENKDTG